MAFVMEMTPSQCMYTTSISVYWLALLGFSLLMQSFHMHIERYPILYEGLIIDRLFMSIIVVCLSVCGLSECSIESLWVSVVLFC